MLIGWKWFCKNLLFNFKSLKIIPIVQSCKHLFLSSLNQTINKEVGRFLLTHFITLDSTSVQWVKLKNCLQKYTLKNSVKSINNNESLTTSCCINQFDEIFYLNLSVYTLCVILHKKCNSYLCYIKGVIVTYGNTLWKLRNFTAILSFFSRIPSN